MVDKPTYDISCVLFVIVGSRLLLNVCLTHEDFMPLGASETLERSSVREEPPAQFGE